MLERVASYIERNHMICADDQLLVGVSGGADSVCLLLILQELQKRFSFSITVMHVNHGIRQEEAKRDEDFVVSLCKKLSLPCHVADEDVPHFAKEQGMSLEEAGRWLRYRALGEFAEKIGAKIAVAHHRDDEDETMLLHLLRGCGPNGLSGMKPVSKLRIGQTDMVVVRPLLEEPKEELLCYLKKRRQEYVTDSTNLNADTSRNRLRLELLPYLRNNFSQEISLMLLRTRETMAETEDYLQKQADVFLQTDGYSGGGEGIYWVKASALKNCHPALHPYIFRKVFQIILQQEPADFFKIHFEMLQGLLSKQSGKMIDLPQNIRVYKEYDRLVFFCAGQADRSAKEGLNIHNCRIQIAYLEDAEHFFEKNCKRIQKEPYTKWIDCDKIKETLVFRTRKKGDFLKINGQGQTKKLQDYMVDQKIPASLRDHWPLLADGNEIVWVCGYRISETYYITSETKNIAEITLITLEGDMQEVGE